MNKKIKYGQFFTKRSEYIIGNLLEDIQSNKIIVEPFCGEGDLLLLNNKFELYDIDPKIENCIEQNTLLNPPSYKNKLVITNPPFLSKNKNSDKSIYEKYNVGDLYKAAIISILECDGGILIVPLNFFCDEDINIRNLFFEKFDIIKLNIFEETVFDDTSYTICSFSFKKRIDIVDKIEIKCIFHPTKEIRNFELEKETGWRIGNNFLRIIEKQNNIGIKRLVKNGKPNSNIYLRAIDTGTNDGRISLCLNEQHFYGKDSDRTFATIILDKEYTLIEQQLICDVFNNLLETNRTEYNSMFLTNYRNSTSSYSRKRISFDVAYKLISYIIQNLIEIDQDIQ